MLSNKGFQSTARRETSRTSRRSRQRRLVLERLEDRRLLTDYVAPTADIWDVSPDPRTGAVPTITIAFTEPVFGVDLSDFSLHRGTCPKNLSKHSQIWAKSRKKGFQDRR